MTGRQRVKRAMHYQAVDKAPLQYYYAPVGYYEHGERLNDLYAALPGDFAPYERMPIPEPAAADFSSDGEYRALRTDEWGVTREFRIFGVQGLQCGRVIGDADEALKYRLPPLPECEGAEFHEYAARVQRHKQGGFYALEGCGNLYERLISLCGDESVLCALALDEPWLCRLADRIIEYDSALVKRAILSGADGVAFGDDYGTERAMLMSPACWRRFFKPRLMRLFAPAVAAGLDVHFHSCGQIAPILEDLRDIGVTSIWPQLPAYDMEELARQCRELELAVAIHTDRARTMTYGTPAQVRDLVMREYDTFRMPTGGSWFYVEADNGFPFANIQALVEAIAMWR